MRRTFDRDDTVHRRFVPDRYHPQKGADVWKTRRAAFKRADELGLRISLTARGSANEHFINVTRRVATALGVDHTGPGLSERAQTVLRNPNARTTDEKKRAASLIKRHSARKDAVAEALHYARLGITEKPAGSNGGPYITAWQTATGRGATYLHGQPWCGVFCENVCRDVGVNAVPQWAGVALIEDYARQSRGGFTGYHAGYTSAARAGDLVILFGRGVHVEMIVEVHSWGYDTVGGNTSSGPGGSQSNGGGVFKRTRAASDVHGVALVSYPA